MNVTISATTEVRRNNHGFKLHEPREWDEEQLVPLDIKSIGDGFIRITDTDTTKHYDINKSDLINALRLF